MPTGGQLTIKSEREGPDWVSVSIADTGVGIPEEDMEKLFEPLFTTKAKGIGLGLAIVKTIVDGHEGTIEVESELGKGSVFFIRLPMRIKEED
jgi:signal transduction histidine kinase